LEAYTYYIVDTLERNYRMTFQFILV